MPCNLDAERAILGALLIENTAYDQIAGQLETAHFFRDAHRKIYEALTSRLSAQQATDLVSLKEELDRRSVLEDVGGAAYIGALVDGLPRSTNVRYYAEIVREKALLRRLIKVGSGLIEKAYAGSQAVTAIVAELDESLLSVALQARVASGPVPLAEGLPALTRDLDARVAKRGQIIGLPSGFPGLDALTHGWQRRKMIVIAGQTSFGKSVLALCVARAVAEAGERVVYYSFEMERQELEYRLLSSLSSIPLTQILWGNLSESEYRRLAAAMEVMHGLPLEITDSAGRTVAEVRAECRQIRGERGLGAVVLDHLQLMHGPGETRYEMFAGISTGVKGLANELDVPVFALSQLTLSDKDGLREPQLDDLRECKSIGHDADMVLMLHPYAPKEARTDVAVVPMKLLMRKQRGGRLGVVPLHLERDYVRFVEGEAPAPVVKEVKPKRERAFTY